MASQYSPEKAPACPFMQQDNYWQPCLFTIAEARDEMAFIKFARHIHGEHLAPNLSNLNYDVHQNYSRYLKDYVSAYVAFSDASLTRMYGPYCSLCPAVAATEQMPKPIPLRAAIQHVELHLSCLRYTCTKCPHPTGLPSALSVAQHFRRVHPRIWRASESDEAIVEALLANPNNLLRRSSDAFQDLIERKAIEEFEKQLQQRLDYEKSRIDGLMATHFPFGRLETREEHDISEQMYYSQWRYTTLEDFAHSYALAFRSYGQSTLMYRLIKSASSKAIRECFTELQVTAGENGVSNLLMLMSHVKACFAISALVPLLGDRQFTVFYNQLHRDMNHVLGNMISSYALVAIMTDVKTIQAHEKLTQLVFAGRRPEDFARWPLFGHLTEAAARHIGSIPAELWTYYANNFVEAATKPFVHVGAQAMVRALFGGSDRSGDRAKLQEVLLANAENLSHHEYGNYSIQALLYAGKDLCAGLRNTIIAEWDTWAQGSVGECYCLESVIMTASENDLCFLVESLIAKASDNVVKEILFSPKSTHVFRCICAKLENVRLAIQVKEKLAHVQRQAKEELERLQKSWTFVGDLQLPKHVNTTVRIAVNRVNELDQKALLARSEQDQST